LIEFDLFTALEWDQLKLKFACTIEGDNRTGQVGFEFEFGQVEVAQFDFLKEIGSG
jgi:hypothetical protein